MTSPTIAEISQTCLASRVRLINRLVTGLYDTALRPHGLRISQMNVLVAVATRGPLRAADVGRLMKLEKSTLSRDLERLVAQGWMVRSPELKITPAGSKLLTAAAPAWQRAQRQARRLLTPTVADGTMAAVQDLWQREGLLD